MQKGIFLFLIITNLARLKSSIYTKEKRLPYINSGNDNFQAGESKNKLDWNYAKSAQHKSKVFQRFAPKKEGDVAPSVLKDPDIIRQIYRRDPVLNVIRRNKDARRLNDLSTDSASSSSLEMKNWKDEWKEHWLLKKLEAINSSIPKGDKVNMVAARPWGVPCGDPNQHDSPWGSCMLPMECEPEYRIYRGDFYCGRTKFVCCGLLMTAYDLYAGFDVSFEDSILRTDSDEKKNRDRGSKERKRRKRKRDQKRRRRERLKRKRKIKRDIKKIIREITKILNRSFRNGTTARKKKTKQLKKFIKEMKRKYKKDRKAVKDIHEMEMVQIDAALQKRLNEIKGMNQEYIKNSTFRDIVVNGTINKNTMRMLMKAYPELKGMIGARRTGGLPDYLEYDIEYGLVYE
ncbi:unnamed protein product [Colias eurytheme]|nr:unnamed protein product [Colias eurytheme]